MADAGEDGVDGISVDAEQEVSSEMAIGLHVADHGFDGGASAQLAADGGGNSALLSGDEDLSALGFGAVAAIAAIDIGAGDGNAGDPLDLLDLAGQDVAIIRVARPALHAEDELTAGCSGVGGGNRDLHAELEAGPGFPLADALHLGRVQGIELVGTAVGALLAKQAIDQAQRFGEHGLRFSVACDLARDVTRQPTQPGAQLAHARLGLPAFTTMMKSGRLLPGVARDPAIRLAQRDAVLARHAGECFDTLVQQFAVGRMGGGRQGSIGAADGKCLEGTAFGWTVVSMVTRS